MSYDGGDCVERLRRGVMGGTSRPGRVVRSPLDRAGQGIESRLGVPESFRAEHRARIKAHQERVSNDLQRLGIPQGNSLVVCVCGEETTDVASVRMRKGWGLVGGRWCCMVCKEGKGIEGCSDGGYGKYEQELLRGKRSKSKGS